MPELRGKGWRVLGYFVWMLAAGVVLDRPDMGGGSVGLALGAALFAFGVAQSMIDRRRRIDTASAVLEDR